MVPHSPPTAARGTSRSTPSLSFTAVTSAPTAERVTVAGTVERYVASSYAFTGSGAAQSVTYLAAFVRN
jgi:hypothetical protein